MQTKRLFLAIKIEADTTFVELYNEIRNKLMKQDIKWVDLNNLHLTLKFYGETNTDLIPIICDKVEETIKGISAFDFHIIKTGVFGSSYQPKVIWFGISANPFLAMLAENILDSMAQIGFERDRQNFVPHLTIGRIKYIDDKKLFSQIISKYTSVDIQKVNVKEILLYESILRKEGPIYKIEKVFKLLE